MKFAVIIAVAATVAAQNETLVEPTPMSVGSDTEPTTSTWNYNSEKANVTTTTIRDPNTHSKITEMRRKYRDYFAYSFMAKNITEEDAGLMIADCSSASECADSGETQQCCVHTVLKHKATNTQDVQYRCMTKEVVHANMDITLGDFSVKMMCMHSGAFALATGALSAMSVAASLY